MDINIGDIVKLKKQHPCGSFDWKVVRLGADIGLECCQCKHRVLLSRRELAHRLKRILPKDSDDKPTA